jgi:predicted ABC-type transport system involved in lysophospholipase L1 biosynthesis ATPase subunit
MATEAQVQLQSVTKTYQMGEVQVHALCGLGLAVQEGEFVVIVGPSGSGKTTALNLIGGLDTPTRGELVVAGANIAGYDEKALTAYRRDQIGFIFQFFNLLPTLTASENIEFALELVEKNGHKVHQQALALLEKVGLAERADHFPSQLSGGEQNLLVGLLALVPGLALGVMSTYYLFQVFSASADFYLPFYIAPLTYGIVILLIFGTALLSQIPAMRRANRMDLAEATKVVA